jgi:hypothetical protein
MNFVMAARCVVLNFAKSCIAFAFLIASAGHADECACRVKQQGVGKALKALYVAEESFYAEHETYTTDIAAIGFKPPLGLPYRFVVTYADAKVEARSTSAGPLDLWQEGERNVITHPIDGCAKEKRAGVPMGSKAPFVDGAYLLVPSKLVVKPTHRGKPWDPDSLPDLIAQTTTAQDGTQFADYGRNRLSSALPGLFSSPASVVHIKRGDSMRFELWDNDIDDTNKKENELVTSLVFVPSDVPLDADGNGGITLPGPDIDGDFCFQLKRIPSPEGLQGIVLDRKKALKQFRAFFETRRASTACKRSTGDAGGCSDIPALHDDNLELQGRYIETCANQKKPAIVACMQIDRGHKLLTVLATPDGAPLEFYAQQPRDLASPPLPGDCKSVAAANTADTFSDCRP